MVCQNFSTFQIVEMILQKKAQERKHSIEKTLFLCKIFHIEIIINEP